MEVIDRLETKDFIELEDQYGAHNYHPLDVVIEHAEGVWVYDVEGNRYLDCLASYSAVNQGHCHPKILKAMIEQARRVTLTSRAFRNDQLPLFYQELHDTILCRVASGCLMLQLALDVSQQTAHAEAEEFCTHPRQAEFLFHHGQTVDGLLCRADPPGRLEADRHSGLLSVFADGANHDQAHR